MSDLQTSVSISNGVISGNIAYVTEGALPDYWGAGNFLVLKFAKNDPTVTSIKVGIEPSKSGMKPVELDEDMNCAFQVNSVSQRIKVIQSDGKRTQTQYYSLSGLTLAEATPSA